MLVRLGLVREATVTLAWHPGDRSARVVSVAGSGIGHGRLNEAASLFDLSLLVSGTQFNPGGLMEVARWGHFSHAEFPWERVSRL
jgi:hypothetical protein